MGRTGRLYLVRGDRIVSVNFNENYQKGLPKKRAALTLFHIKAVFAAIWAYVTLITQDCIL